MWTDSGVGDLSRPRRRHSSTAPTRSASSTSAPPTHHSSEVPDCPAPAGAVSVATSGTVAVCDTVRPATVIDTRTVVGSVGGVGNVSTNRLRSTDATWSNGRSVPGPPAATATPPVAAAASDQ